ncbi:MAG: 4Fe-4S dicluster domain-containing protein [bacterium]|nr:4Fe-4S dicluster domain-containing protein [bacterium]
MTTIINGVLLLVTDILIVVFLYSSLQERENRAVGWAVFSLVGNSALWLCFVYFRESALVSGVNIAIYCGMVVFGLISVIKYFPRGEERDLSSVEQCDERDTIFGRSNLKNHPRLFETYYASHPERKEVDDKFHNKPGLGEPGHFYYDSYRSPMFESAFKYLNRTRSASGGKVAFKKDKTDSARLASEIKKFAYLYGAVDVGFTLVKPYQLYTHSGRQAESWGQEINSSHSTAIVIVVGMKVDMIKGAPGLPAIMESSHQYVEAAKIAHIIAEYIRGMGWDARSQVDGNYQALCVPMAVDAGLGALGRMGLFMHPVYGPCVRISVVTTDLELDCSDSCDASHIRSIETFCDICKKCADNCPTQSISSEEENSSRGFRHWGIHQEKCYTFWRNIGTDCGFCIRVCPYTKPNTLIHKLVRFYISRNPLNQHIALFMDDLFYGRKISLPKAIR